MKNLWTKVLSAGLFLFALCIGLHLGGTTVKADTVASTQEGVVLKTTTVSTKKVIKVPVKQVEVVQPTKTTKSSSLSRGTGSSSNTTKSSSKSGGTTIASGSTSSIVQYAFQFLGRPYVYGANGPKAFDCSGFTSYVYRQFGVSLPRTAAEQSSVGESVSKGDLRPGDLLFFNTSGYISHAGMYIGDGQFIHASSGSRCITVSDLSESYYTRTFVKAKRIMR